jgi:hypothetical protein
MTNLPLSLAAQAILNAATLYIYDVVADDAPGAISRVSAEAAVVLRAAADHVGEWESAEELRALAAELEAL